MWRRFWQILILTALAPLAGLALALSIIDPWGTLPLSPPLPRAAMDSNQRYAYPMIARAPGHDSLVIGTSVTRLLKPRLLDSALGGHWANLSMNSATAHEQAEMFKLWRRHQPAPRALLVGVDMVWCEQADSIAPFTFRPFPPWLYDESRWNDYLYLLNEKAVAVALRQLRFWAGLKDPAYDADGYASFLPPMAEYDLDRARTHLYPAEPRQDRPDDSTSASRAAWPYPALDLLSGILSAMPADAHKFLLLVPYHLNGQPPAGTLAAAQLGECKRRLVRMAGATPNTWLLDLMTDNAITRTDSNYWDPLHTTLAVADRLVGFLGDAAAGRRPVGAPWKRLVAPQLEPNP